MDESTDLRTLTIATVGGDGEPIENCNIRISGAIDKQRLDRRETTDADGSLQIQYPTGEVHFFRITVRRIGYVPIHYSWSADNTKPKIPESLKLTLNPSKQWEGRVINTKGDPVENCNVNISMPITWPQIDYHHFTLDTLTTDKEGRWVLNDGPTSSERLSIRITHPDYKDAHAGRSSGGFETTLEQGISLHGSVVDAGGNPVMGAVARLGPDRWGTNEPEATTDAEGKFTLKNCDAGENVVTVQASGHSPEIQKVTILEEDNIPLAFQLDEPHSLKVRVVDVHGEPIAGTTIAVDGWQGYRTLDHRASTNNRGEMVWDSAPGDALICDILHQGYMASRNTTCIPGDDFNVVVLYPELIVTGRVVDKDAEKLVDKFRIIRGQNQSNLSQTYWRNGEVHEFSGGQFTFKFDEPMESWLLQVVAEGYKPAISRKFKSDEGHVRYHFMLERASEFAGSVVDSEGNAVQDAEVFIASQTNPGNLKNGFLSVDDAANKATKTDVDGSFRLTLPEEDHFLIVAVHDQGYREIAKADLPEDGRIQLKPWGTITGRVMLGSEPHPNCQIRFTHRPPSDGRSYRTLEYEYLTQSDDEGNFAFDRVLPGPGTLARMIIIPHGQFVLHASGWQTAVTVDSASETKVQLGGEGIKVSGRFVLDREPAEGIRWNWEPSIALDAVDAKTGLRSDPFCRYVGAVGQDGTFFVPDVPLGTYRVDFKVNAIGPQNRINGDIGRLTTTVEISDENANLGDLTVTLDDTLDPGEVLPRFHVETTSGSVLSDAALSGKLTFVNFWSTYADNSLGDTAQLGSVIPKFIDDPRIQFLSLATEQQIEAAWEEIDERGWLQHSSSWTHAYAGPRNAHICGRFCVKSVPLNFIVGPDGTILAKNVSIQELTSTLSKYAESVDFSAKPRNVAPQFPVLSGSDTRKLTKIEKVNDTAEVPSLFVVDDADQAYENDDGQSDNLIAFDNDLNELWRIPGFETYGSEEHRLAVDPARERIYVCEPLAKRLMALRYTGEVIWQVSELEASCLTLDTKTGNIWVSGGGLITFGETVILSPDGEAIDVLPYRATDLIYNPIEDTFWLAGRHLLIVNRNLELVYREKSSGHMFSSLSVDAQSGHVWAIDRRHSDIAESQNRVLLYDGQAKVLREFVMGDRHAMVVESTHDGSALVGGYKTGLIRLFADGSESQLLPPRTQEESATKESGSVKLETENKSDDVGYRILSLSIDGAALGAISNEPTSRGSASPTVWAATQGFVLKIVDGKIEAQSPIDNTYNGSVVQVP